MDASGRRFVAIGQDEPGDRALEVAKGGESAQFVVVQSRTEQVFEQKGQLRHADGIEALVGGDMKFVVQGMAVGPLCCR